MKNEELEQMIVRNRNLDEGNELLHQQNLILKKQNDDLKRQNEELLARIDFLQREIYESHSHYESIVDADNDTLTESKAMAQFR